MCLSSFIDFKYLNVILWREKNILGRIGLYFCGFGENRINFRDLWNKTKYYQGAEDFFLRDLGRSMQGSKGAQTPGRGAQQ